MTSFVRLSNFDNVVTATKTLQANETIEGIKTLQSVPTGHKIASCDIKKGNQITKYAQCIGCLLYTSPSPRDKRQSRMPSSA